MEHTAQSTHSTIYTQHNLHTYSLPGSDDTSLSAVSFKATDGLGGQWQCLATLLFHAESLGITLVV